MIKKTPKREPQICSERKCTEFWAGNTLSGVSRKHFKKLIGCKFVTEWKKLVLEMYTGYYVELNEVFIEISLHTEWELLSLLFSLIFHFVHLNEFPDFMNVVNISFVWAFRISTCHKNGSPTRQTICFNHHQSEEAFGGCVVKSKIT